MSRVGFELVMSFGVGVAAAAGTTYYIQEELKALSAQ